jgi:hypothetical protein
LREAIALGWTNAMYWLSILLRKGEGCTKDVSQAVIWGAKGNSGVFWAVLEEARQACERDATKQLEGDFNQICYSLGWGFYWCQYGTQKYKDLNDENKAFVERCLDFYCGTMELQQESILTFLLCWNQRSGGVKGPGQMIAKMVWEGREENLLKTFDQNDEEEPELTE